MKTPQKNEGAMHTDPNNGFSFAASSPNDSCPNSPHLEEEEGSSDSHFSDKDTVHISNSPPTSGTKKPTPPPLGQAAEFSL
mmetsp:Transcript_10870/g.16031  ORF Transcript_10870/g.16031 Transcript_10870/m.16031 type:complete len:81 (+) Transcript_10870:421-663(+)